MNKPCVYVGDPLSPRVYERLARKMRIVDNYDHPEELDAIIIRRALCPRSVLEKAKKLKLISMHGTGTDTIDMEAARGLGIPVITHPGYNSQSVAELALSHILALERRLLTIDQGMREGRYHTFGDSYGGEHELFGKKAGVIGTGAVAQKFAAIMRGGFSCHVLAFNAHHTAREIQAMGFIPVMDLKELFRVCDYICVCPKLTAETKYMVNADVLFQANPDLILTNVSRGGVVNEKDLYEALVSHKIRGAASDVFETEPPRADDPILALDNFIGTFHNGGSTVEAMEKLGNATVDDIFRMLGIQE